MQELPRILEMAAGQGFSVTLLLIAVYWFQSQLKAKDGKIDHLSEKFDKQGEKWERAHTEMVRAMNLNAESLQSLADAIEDLKDKIKQ